MQSTSEKLPAHLKRYVVEQNYPKYTPQDQAVWRYILRQLKNHLTTHAHESFIHGLEQSGISEDEIPKIEFIDQKLQNYGWGAVPVNGFIPPAAFMEFQSLGVLPIATDLRSLEHIHYTPAPDIVHESVGHAPILIEENFSKYLKQYATIAKKAIFSKEDLEIYSAIRTLSDLKESSTATKKEIKEAELALSEAASKPRYSSEATLLSRMNWWTAEYGLIGDIKTPKIFGAGLLSSIGESRSCLEPQVKKIPLSLDCIQQNYDITEPQPQLYVTPSFNHLTTVLNQLSETMSYKKGGCFGLDNAIQSMTVNTVEFDSGLQASGILDHYLQDKNKKPIFIKFSSPTQLSFNQQELQGHGPSYHSHGFSCPVGQLKGNSKPLFKFDKTELKRLSIVPTLQTSLQFESGITVSGTVEKLTWSNDILLLISFSNCTVTFGEQILFEPSWGIFDMATGSSVPSVFGGAADRVKYGDIIDFDKKLNHAKNYTENEIKTHDFFSRIRQLRKSSPTEHEKLNKIISEFKTSFSENWLAGIELYEIAQTQQHNTEAAAELKKQLLQLADDNENLKILINDGLDLADQVN